MPVVRAAVGTLLLLVAAPLVLIGGALWVAGAQRGPDGAYAAQLERIQVAGHAAVIDDLDSLLRADAPFARGGQTTLRLTASGPGGPLLVALAPRESIGGYLADVPYTRITRVRLSRGPLPVETIDIAGTAVPAAAPTAQQFWLDSASGLFRDGRAEDPLTWSPSSVRDAGLALVVMRADGTPGLDLTLRASLAPGWLTPTTWGLLILGGCLLTLGVLALAWPSRRDEVVYLVEPAKAPEIAARLGVVVPPVAEPSPVPALASVPASALPPAEQPLVQQPRAEQLRAAGSGAAESRAAGSGAAESRAAEPLPAAEPAATGSSAEQPPAGEPKPTASWAAGPVVAAAQSSTFSGRPPVRLRLAWPLLATDKVTPPPVPVAATSSDPAPRHAAPAEGESVLCGPSGAHAADAVR